MQNNSTIQSEMMGINWPPFSPAVFPLAPSMQQPEAGFLNWNLKSFSNFENCIFLHSLETYTDKYGSKVGD